MTDTKRSADDPVSDSVATPVQKVVVVDGSLDMLGGLEMMLHARRYQMLFAQSSDLAYSQIKKVRPNLVVLCGGIEELDGSQLLTMLKLDPDTRGIPMLSYTPDRKDRDGSQLLTMLKLDPDTRGIPLLSYGPDRREPDPDADLWRLDEDEDMLTPAHPALRMN